MLCTFKDVRYELQMGKNISSMVREYHHVTRHSLADAARSEVHCLLDCLIETCEQGLGFSNAQVET